MAVKCGIACGKGEFDRGFVFHFTPRQAAYIPRGFHRLPQRADASQEPNSCAHSCQGLSSFSKSRIRHSDLSSLPRNRDCRTECWQFSSNPCGEKLMRAAFAPATGPLCDKQLPPG